MIESEIVVETFNSLVNRLAALAFKISILEASRYRIAH